MLALRVLALMVPALLAACGPDGHDRPVSPTAASSAEADSQAEDEPRLADEPPAEAPSADLRACRATLAELRAALEGLPSACASDQDCTCYSGGIAEVTGCGGVSDAPTAVRVRALTQRLRELARRAEPGEACFDRVSCAPRRCVPRCVDGRCVE